MLDRVPNPSYVLANGAIRYGVYNADGTLNRYEYIKPEDAPTQAGTPINKANLFSDAAAEACGLPVAATPNEGFLQLGKAAQTSLLRDLSIMLNLSLGTSNIDAWADFLDNASMINDASSENYSVSGGVLGVAKIEHANGASNANIGYSTSFQRAAQTFTATSSTVTEIVAKLSKVGSPTDNLKMEIWSTTAGLPSSLLYTSSTSISGSSLTTSAEEKSFLFSGATLTVGTVYAFVLSRTGSTNSSNYYSTYYAASGTYSGGNYCLGGSSWAIQSGQDLYFKLYGSKTATVVWNAVAATEPLLKAAISSVQTLGTGSISWHLSDDGVNWAQITTLNTAQTVSFDATSVYLKAVITEGATISSVAWGGY